MCFISLHDQMRAIRKWGRAKPPNSHHVKQIKSDCERGSEMDTPHHPPRLLGRRCCRVQNLGHQTKVAYSHHQRISIHREWCYWEQTEAQPTSFFVGRDGGSQFAGWIPTVEEHGNQQKRNPWGCLAQIRLILILKSEGAPSASMALWPSRRPSG